MISRKYYAVALMGAAALALTACGGDGGGGGTAASDGRDPLPLDAFWEDSYGEWDEAAANAEQMEVEELTAQCMAREGFEYIPVDWSQGGGMVSMSSDDLDVEWGSREFAEQYGYGATTNPWGDFEEPIAEEPGEEWSDPNWELVEAMSEAEQTAYYAALYGDQSMYENFTEEDWETYEWNWEDSGCSGFAQNEVYGDQMGGDGSEFEALWTDMDAMWTASQEDPRLATALSEWSACMAEAGYPGLVEIWDAQNQFYESTNSVWDEIYANVNWDDPNLDYEGLDKQYQDRMAEFTDEEIAMATAEWDCKDSTGYADIEYEVMFEYQQEFLETHQAELEAYAESMS